MKAIIGLILSDQMMVNVQTYRKHRDRFFTINKFFTLQKDFPVVFLHMTKYWFNSVQSLSQPDSTFKILVTFQKFIL